MLIGWSAVTNSLSWTPVILFLIVFLWTPPHYWPLSLKFRMTTPLLAFPCCRS